MYLTILQPKISTIPYTKYIFYSSKKKVYFWFEGLMLNLHLEGGSRRRGDDNSLFYFLNCQQQLLLFEKKNNNY